MLLANLASKSLVPLSIKKNNYLWSGLRTERFTPRAAVYHKVTFRQLLPNLAIKTENAESHNFKQLS